MEKQIFKQSEFDELMSEVTGIQSNLEKYCDFFDTRRPLLGQFLQGSQN